MDDVRTTAQNNGAADASSPPDDESLHQRIAQRAYGRYCERGRIDGFDMEDWLAAEQEVLQEHAAVTAGPATRSRPAARRGSGRTAAAPGR